MLSEWRRIRDEQQARFWQLVKEGSTFSQACEAVGVDRRQGYRWRRTSGGRPPTAPRIVSARFLSLEERLQIADLRLAGSSMRAIGTRLGRAPSTISRELARNVLTPAPAVDRPRYAPYAAHKRAELRARRPKPFKLDDPQLALIVQAKLCLKWSPQQISLYLAGEHGDEAAMQVSHEHLPGLVRAGPRAVARGAAPASAHRAGVAASTRPVGREQVQDPGHGLDQRAACRGRRPGGTWPLGGGFDHGVELSFGDR